MDDFAFANFFVAVAVDVVDDEVVGGDFAVAYIVAKVVVVDVIVDVRGNVLIFCYFADVIFLDRLVTSWERARS